MSCRSRTITTPSPARWRTSGGQRLSLTHGQGMRMSHIKYSDPKAVTYSWSVVAMAHCREKGRDNISKQWLHCMIRAGQVSRFCRRVSASLRNTVLSTRYRDCVDFSPLVIDVTHHASKKIPCHSFSCHIGFGVKIPDTASRVNFLPARQ